MSEYTDNKSAFIQEIANNASISGGLQALLSKVIGGNADDVKKAYECINEFFNSPLHDKNDVKIKKLYAAALSIAAEKGFIPKMPPETVAIIADFSATRDKAFYQYGVGKIDMDTAAETIADTATTGIVAVSRKVITPAVIEKGLNVCVDLISKMFPTAQILKLYTAPLAKWAAAAINKAIEKVAPAIKSAIKKTVVSVAKATTRVFGTVKAKLKNILA